MDNGRTTLKEELAKHIGETVYIGARSSFFFIGPAEEALSSLPFLASMLCRRSSRTNSDGLGNRRVKRIYENDAVNGSTTIIIEGKEFGGVWTRKEYLDQKKTAGKIL